MTQTGSTVCVAALVTMLIFSEGGEQSPSLPQPLAAPNGGALDAGFSPYQSTRLSRYYAGP